MVIRHGGQRQSGVWGRAIVSDRHKLQSDVLSKLAASKAGCLLLLSQKVLGFEFVGVFAGGMGESNSTNWIIVIPSSLGSEGNGVCIVC